MSKIDFLSYDEYHKFELARSIVTTSSELKLYGCLMYKFDLQIVENEHMTAYVTIRNNTLYMVFGSGIIKRFKTPMELAYVIIHEITHVLSKHLSRGKGHDHELYNLAGDHVINTALDNDINSKKIRKLQIPAERFVINCLINKNMTTEEVYKFLQDNATKETYTIPIVGSNSNSQSQSGSSSSNSDDNQEQEQNSDNDSNSNSESGENKEKSNSEKSKNKPKSDKPNTQIENIIGNATITVTKIKLPDGQEIILKQDLDFNGELEKNSEAESKIQADARRLLNSPIFQNKLKGSDKGQLMTMIEEAIKVEIPWFELLEKVIKQNISERSDNKSWRKVNKRMYNYNMILPDNDMEETYDKLYVVIDTSGSISDDELRKFFDVIKQAMYHFKHIVKIDHDSDIDNIQLYTSDSFNFNSLSNISFGGRGGTSHKNVYDYIEAKNNGDETYQIFNKINPDTDDIPGLILFMTDFCSDIESIHNKYKWTHDIPFKYLLTCEHSIPGHIDSSPILIK
jgi:predicted metal-dependent peptidase